MGMDIYGRKPRTNSGEYFRMTIGHWPLLWRYCEAIAPDIIPKDNGGYYNDGWGLNNKNALKLAQRLQEWYDSGDCELWKEEVERAHTELVSNVCPDCTASKPNSDADSIKCFAINNLELNDINAVSGATHISSLVNKVHGDYECDTCCDTKIKSYRVIKQTFHVESVPRFIEFLLNCGGFSIW